MAKILPHSAVVEVLVQRRKARVGGRIYNATNGVTRAVAVGVCGPTANGKQGARLPKTDGNVYPDVRR